MYEVEVKAKLRNRESILKKLKDLGCSFSENLHQIDEIFIEKDAVFPTKLGTPVLRVRAENDRYLFTLKMQQTNRQDCIEREMEIEDGPKMVEIIKMLGWKQVPTVDKNRIKTKLGDIEVVLDEVKDLGEYIEAEKVLTSNDQEERIKVQNELYDFLEELGIPREDFIIDGKYDIMLFDKFGMK